MSDGTRKLIIAIDGPAGAGKSTVASHVARSLGYVNLETGAMYRALALKALENDVPLEEEGALLGLAQETRIELEPAGEMNRVLLDGRDVSERVRGADVTAAASRVSVHPTVRRWMVDRQREMGRAGGVVMEGRDVGTVVFPHADVKIFLDARPEVRAERRYLQNGTSDQGKPESVLAQMRERDRRDRTRATSPLVPAPDAVVLDSSEMPLQEVLARVEEIIRSKSAG